MENLENKKYWIWFSLIKGLGCVRKNKSLKIYGTPEEIYKLSKSGLLKIDGIGDETVKDIIEAKNEKILNYHIKYMKENNIDIIHICEKSYPQILKQIYDAPVSLYIRGNKEILKLHDDIYEKIIPSHFKKSIQYIPHITLGQADNLEDFSNFNYEFTTIVDEVSIELIGKHEQSIIIKNIKI